jgi:hypothetical protein
MQNTLIAGFVYFLLVFVAGFVLGVIRTVLVVPIVGHLVAVLIELPFMLAVSWIACGWALGRFPVPRAVNARLLMGTFALVLLLLAEVFISVKLGNLSVSEHFALYKTLPAMIGLLGQIVFALFPLEQAKIL